MLFLRLTHPVQQKARSLAGHESKSFLMSSKRIHALVNRMSYVDRVKVRGLVQ